MSGVLIGFGVIVIIGSPWLIKKIPPSDEVKIAIIEQGFIEIDGDIKRLQSPNAVPPPPELQDVLGPAIDQDDSE